MPTAIERVNTAIQDLKNGKMVILTDHPDRENEGDLIIPAEIVTPEQINFMIRHCSGIVCLPMTSAQVKKLQLPFMVPPNHNTSCYGTPFTISIDAKHGVSTGVSAADRTKTIHVAVDETTKPDDLVRPGHIFPLQARDGGVLERHGHTEGSTDLVKLAGFKPAAVLCEIMNPDGTMARGLQLNTFAKTHQLSMLSIDDIITYRLLHEDMIEDTATATVPLEKYGTFKMTVVREKISSTEHVILINDTKQSLEPMLVRVHSACTTGDLFASNRCDCHKQFHYALQRISEEGGMLIYLNQEGRGIGLFNKIKAYALQEQGFDTVEANEQLGLPVDSRKYYVAANILRNEHINHVRLLTNNPDKINDLKKYGIPHVDRILMPSFHNEHNHHYLTTKMTKLNHAINFDYIPELQRISK
jgi:3,4-dihydroxy 2-butanone 4-phosphate synthase/GTP cyclohydrolase II